MIKFVLPLMLFSMNAFAGGFKSVDLSYAKGDFGNVYHDSGERIIFNGDFSETNSFFIGYEHVHRDYTSEVGFNRDALLIGDTAVFKNHYSYLEFVGSYAGDTVVGPQTAISLIPHTTYFGRWDLSLGLHYAHYNTGDVQSFQPQIIFFINDLWSIGHSSWFYEDGGWHHAHREFLRGRYKSWGAELSWAGGENREDVGFIDQFNSYSITTTYYFKRGNHIYLTLEDYQGNSRKGSQWGTGVRCSW
ncbi:hypothetical protein [Bdellovibrio sp. HCB209]|uniref:hypothetical protein n=1 Tax=Bdellovibrio sp. HCB209 TaxID=3394354 RepID=UPI0039B497C7